MDELAYESCGLLDMVPLTAEEEGEEEVEEEQVEELIIRIAEFVEETIAFEETIALEDDSEEFMEAHIRKQQLVDYIEAIAEYVEEAIVIEEKQKALRLQDCRKQDTEALVEAIAEYVEETIALEEEELKEAVEEYVVDLKKAFEESKQELTSVRSGVRFLETWYLKKPPRADDTRSSTTENPSTASAGTPPLKGTGSRKRDFEGNVRYICPR